MINLDPAEISQCRWMGLDEFLQTQSHPLITAVLSRSYGLDGAEGAAACAEGLGAGQPAPLVEMIEAGVQNGPAANLTRRTLQQPPLRQRRVRS